MQGRHSSPAITVVPNMDIFHLYFGHMSMVVRTGMSLSDGVILEASITGRALRLVIGTQLCPGVSVLYHAVM